MITEKDDGSDDGNGIFNNRKMIRPFLLKTNKRTIL
jgi:hypothetical protein